jgi:hypothetical protein
LSIDVSSDGVADHLDSGGVFHYYADHMISVRGKEFMMRDFNYLWRALLGREPLPTDRARGLDAAVAALRELDREVIMRRFGVGGGERELLAAIAADHPDLILERARLVEARALRRLRECLCDENQAAETLGR